MRRGERTVRRAGGFTYIGLLAIIVLIGILLAAAGEVTRTAVQRQHEAELLWVGHQYRDAIGRYLARYHRYPAALEELLGSNVDAVLPFHALRQLYRDPMTNGADWTLVPAVGGGVMGVASSSALEPLKTRHFDEVDQDFELATAYRDWQFTYVGNVTARRRAVP